MKIQNHKRGFTFVEILIVVAIISILTAVSAVAFRSMYVSATLRSGTQEAFGALTDARGATLAAENDSVYGVHFSSTTITRFIGSSYTQGDINNTVYIFEGDVSATSSIINAGGAITFSRLTGLPSMTGTIDVYDKKGNGTSTIQVHGSGLIEIN